jgi:hypothetical protein
LPVELFYQLYTDLNMCHFRLYLHDQHGSPLVGAVRSRRQPVSTLGFSARIAAIEKHCSGCSLSAQTRELRKCPSYCLAIKA